MAAKLQRQQISVSGRCLQAGGMLQRKRCTTVGLRCASARTRVGIPGTESADSVVLHLQAALLMCGSMSGALPVAAGAYMVVCLVWLNATVGLARDMSGSAESSMVSCGGGLRGGVGLEVSTVCSAIHLLAHLQVLGTHTGRMRDNQARFAGACVCPGGSGNHWRVLLVPEAGRTSNIPAAPDPWCCAAAVALQVMASIDNTPLLEAPAPAKLMTPQGQVLVPPGLLDQEVKESMQSHFD